MEFLVNPLVWGISTVAMTVAGLTMLYAGMAGIRLNQRVYWVVLLVSMLVAAINSVSSVSGMVCSSFIPPFGCSGGVFFPKS